MTKIRVADYIANFLESKSVTKVFLLSGGGMMHLLDAVSRTEKLGYVCNHHEQASAIAAEGYARQSNKLGVCYATSGPGATNVITGLVGAWQDSSPVLFITGQSKLEQTIKHSGLKDLRQFGTFEVNIVPIVQSITKYAVMLEDATMIRYHLEKAYATALQGRPGPVLIDIPIDLQGALINPDELQAYESEFPLASLPSDKVITDILQRLSAAKRPLILAGHGIRVAEQAAQFEQIIKLLNIPVVTTQLAKDLLAYDNPLFIGHPGMKGDRAGNFAVQNADVILSLGSSLHVLTTGYELDKFAPQAYKIQIDLDENVLQRQQVGVNQQVVCDIASFLQKLSRHCPTTLATDIRWITMCQRWKHDLAVQNEPHEQKANEINYYDFIDVISDICQGNETIVTDAGSAFYVVGQAFRTKKGQRVIISGALGAMGFALPAATGASFAAPLRTVICITGDGSLQTNLHELATIKHHQLNIKLFIINNNGYISIKNTQDNFFKGHCAGVNKNSGVSFPNLQKIAEAYDISYASITSRAELTQVCKEKLLQTGPMIIEVYANQQQVIIPTVSSEKLASGKMVSKPLDDMFPFMDEAKRKIYSFHDLSEQVPQ